MAGCGINLAALSLKIAFVYLALQPALWFSRRGSAGDQSGGDSAPGVAK